MEQDLNFAKTMYQQINTTGARAGISWYVIDGKQPYMTGEDAEKFKKMCEETGEFPLKKFAEMTVLFLC